MYEINASKIEKMASVLPAGLRNGMKGMDANKYATKKTVAQGMLDIALLTSNASQLKYVLQVGQKHEFYTLLVTLISVSIFLQVMMGLVLLSLNLFRDCRLHLPHYNESANYINYFTTACAFVVTVVNCLISTFDSNLAKYLGPDIEASAGVMTIVLSRMSDTQEKMADRLYHVSVGFLTGAIFCDVLKMTFGLDPALSIHDLYGNQTILGALIGIILGYVFNINLEPDQRRAELLNNISLGFTVTVMAVNVVLGIFYSMHVDMQVNPID